MGETKCRGYPEKDRGGFDQPVNRTGETTGIPECCGSHGSNCARRKLVGGAGWSPGFMLSRCQAGDRGSLPVASNGPARNRGLMWQGRAMLGISYYCPSKPVGAGRHAQTASRGPIIPWEGQQTTTRYRDSVVSRAAITVPVPRNAGAKQPGGETCRWPRVKGRPRKKESQHR